MTHDASDPKSIRRAEKAARLEAAARIDYLRHIMSTPPGRAWMHDLLATAGMFQELFVPSNQYATAYNLGRASVAKPIWGEVFEHCPNQYVLMMQEQYLKEPPDGRRTPSDPDPDPGFPTEPAGAFPDTGRDDQRPEPDPAASVGPDGIVSWR